MARLTPATCAECDDPVMMGSTGWYRCRSCGYEAIRPPLQASPALQVAQAVYGHWCTYEAPENATEKQLRAVAREAIRQGDLFADEWARVHS